MPPTKHLSSSELEPLLEDAVRRQLVADVPVGVLLSGGVDSSLVTAMAVRAKPNVKTFTVRFPGHGKYDETEHARMIARHFGTEHIELDAGEVKVDLLPMLARQFDEPMVDSSMIPDLPAQPPGAPTLHGGARGRWGRRAVCRIPALQPAAVDAGDDSAPCRPACGVSSPGRAMPACRSASGDATGCTPWKSTSRTACRWSRLFRAAPGGGG